MNDHDRRPTLGWHVLDSRDVGGRAEVKGGFGFVLLCSCHSNLKSLMTPTHYLIVICDINSQCAKFSKHLNHAKNCS